MTPRISVRPAALITFVAVVLALLSVTGLVTRHGAVNGHDTLAVSAVSADALPSHRVQNRPHPIASPVSHRTSVQTAERRLTTTVAGQGAEIHFPGGSPDVPATLTDRAWFLPTGLIDLPIDAFAQVVATTVSLSHRGRAPPASGYST
ncbi:hypothetical protein [Kineosporia sp. NBRC 101731]|uniref:hypothetical protein n=1 Tax=Kineosporia sp. NBRC 101731 TaxID=3032199 RepID=UPI0024A38151|nr:hypothetical protein [Kineosporia sp. NBRC 101731]GLY32781.1 hypothetical protein Kisp02_61460 [Kineosporia sp. NBRC 101731]